VSGGLRAQPKVFRAAFVEYGLTSPPLVVGFQFNPMQLTRSRTLDFSMTAAAQWEGERPGLTLRDFHQNFQDLLELRDAQQVSMHPESLSFELRLDATDKLNEGDQIAGKLGIGPQLATLELMVQPKRESVLGSLVRELLPGGFSFTCTDKPPMVLFVWGRKRVLPVNINSMTITETEFTPSLEPIRATVAVDLTVIEGPNPAHLYTKTLKEVSSGLHLANLRAVDVTDLIIPR
jgi:hypothetical protein